MNLDLFFKQYFYKNIDKLNNYRIKIDTGFACNANCWFCYYKSHLKDPFMDLKLIQNQIKKAKFMNFKKIEFSGGESSYHPDWFKMIEFGSKLDLKISTISNGFMFSDFDFIKKSKDLGLEEILFSVHGFEDIHDKMLGVKGAWNKITKALENGSKLDLILRINITVTPTNQNTIYKQVKFLLDNFNIHQFNFILFNNFSDAKKIKVNYKDMDFETLYKSLDLIETKINHKRAFNLRYFPFCQIDEKYHFAMYNYLQHWFDEYDWCPMFFYEKDFNIKNISNFKKQNINYFIKKLINNRNILYFYDKKCIQCQYKGICDGWKKI